MHSSLIRLLCLTSLLALAPAGLLGGTLQIAGFLSDKAKADLRWKFKHMPSESHGTVPHRSTYEGLEYIFDGWWLQDPMALYDSGGFKAVGDQVASTRVRLGYGPEPPLSVALSVFVGLLRSERLQETLDFVSELDPIQYPVPSGYLNYLAGLFEDSADLDGAKRCYEHCLSRYPSDEVAAKQLKALEEETPKVGEDKTDESQGAGC